MKYVPGRWPKFKLLSWPKITLPKIKMLEGRITTFPKFLLGKPSPITKIAGPMGIVAGELGGLLYDNTKTRKINKNLVKATGSTIGALWALD
jgi:hypothetical protein